MEGRFYLPNGAVVLSCHGTPGARRRFPLLGRRAAEELGAERLGVVGLRTFGSRLPKGAYARSSAMHRFMSCFDSRGVFRK